MVEDEVRRRPGFQGGDRLGLGVARSVEAETRRLAGLLLRHDRLERILLVLGDTLGPPDGEIGGHDRGRRAEQQCPDDSGREHLR